MKQKSTSTADDATVNLNGINTILASDGINTILASTFFINGPRNLPRNQPGYTFFGYLSFPYFYKIKLNEIVELFS